jgi:hypothetical protein
MGQINTYLYTYISDCERSKLNEVETLRGFPSSRLGQVIIPFEMFLSSPQFFKQNADIRSTKTVFIHTLYINYPLLSNLSTLHSLVCSQRRKKNVFFLFQLCFHSLI